MFGYLGEELPYYTKFLLIASFLASYNSAKSDKRFFSEVCTDSLILLILILVCRKKNLNQNVLSNQKTRYCSL